MPPIGVFGGTFDPVHDAHLRLAGEALAALGLASIRWVPSGVPGHRDSPQASAADRLAMLELALAIEPRYRLDDFELRLGKPTYTVNTLARLRSELGRSVPLVFLIGADQLLALDRWKEWKTLFELAHFGVARRPGYPVDATSMPAAVAVEFEKRRAAPADIARRPAGLIALFDMTPLDISSSAIREALARGRTPHDVLPGPVLDYIVSKALYRNQPETKGTPSPA
jgi:nicotinate-nucleotide adenylyltransferase